MLPDADDLPEILLDLAVPHEDINELVALRRLLTRDPGATRLLEECVEGLVRDMGRIGGAAPWPGERIAELFTGQVDGRAGEEPGTPGRYFAVYVFVAALPYVRAHHHALGIPPEVTRRTLADLGRNMAVYRRRYGRGGVQAPGWLALHFHGELFQLGRLQFQRARVGERTAGLLAATGAAPGADAMCLSLHVPDFHGPLSPAACDRSLALALDLFARRFPGERYSAGVCHSWLLDPQLKRYLGADSNIVRFQERFRIAEQAGEPVDTEPVQFVFGNPDLPVAGLPRRTTVERAVGDHLRAGGHWYIGHGWFPLPTI
ncbi:acyltransferase domain-containing protein [Streptomyces sp. ADMS]|uniref:acyltransferase domain-containing protein n=1 Tax=Streptomyces sp. ADMS TaxID=3071415 RepID=UPI00296F7A9B|nr:acyltransferase domain-containing protein [Streptomyces sp. ADMS]MDW4907920.1 acyltransferase domain-containing protein [Streptomyces sp. ADMS]